MRWLAPLLLMLAACSKGAAADLASIGEARSLIAEWAMVNEQSSAGRINATYVNSRHAQLREQLQTATSSLKQPNSAYGAEMRAALKLSDDAAPEALRAHSDALKQIEDELESA